METGIEGKKDLKRNTPEEASGLDSCPRWPSLARWTARSGMVIHPEKDTLLAFSPEILSPQCPPRTSLC